MGNKRYTRREAHHRRKLYAAARAFERFKRRELFLNAMGEAFAKLSGELADVIFAESPFTGRLRNGRLR